MQTPISLKSIERKSFQTTFADGLWDVLIACLPLQFAIAQLLSKSLGDFWSSAVFLPFWAVVYLAIWLARKYLIRPRLGTVTIGKIRQKKLRLFTIVMLIVNCLALIVGFLAAYGFMSGGGKSLDLSRAIPFMLGFSFLAMFSFTAFILNYPRLYLYGLLLFIAPLVGEWLYRNHGATHHGYPIVFGFSAGVMILTGFILFIRLLITNPVIETPVEGGQV